jgi:hypothetical protein
VLASLASRSHSDASSRQSSRDSIFRPRRPRRLLSDGPPTAETAAPLTYKIRLPCRRISEQRARAQCTKMCRPSDRWAVQFVRLQGSSAQYAREAAGLREQPPYLGRRPTVPPCRSAHAARFQLLGDGYQRRLPARQISAITARVVALALVACSDLAARARAAVSTLPAVPSFRPLRFAEASAAFVCSLIRARSFSARLA